MRLNFLVVDLALVILTCLVEDHAYLQEAYRDHPFLVVDPCLEVYSMDVLEEGLSYRLEAFHLEAWQAFGLSPSFLQPSVSFVPSTQGTCSSSSGLPTSSY